MQTPDWIAAWVAAHDGGWFFPIRMTPEHPLVVEAWRCLHCDEVIESVDVAMVMPFVARERWVAVHRECSAANILPEPRMRAALRPDDYASLPPERQWLVDKRLRILDWEGERTDDYFTSALKLEEHPGGVIVQKNPADPKGWEGWSCLPPEDQEPPGAGKEGSVRLYKGKWHAFVASAPWWFAKESL